MFENLQIPAEVIPSDPRFGVGPSLVPVEHLSRLAETRMKLMGTSHRKSFVQTLGEEIQSNIANYFSLPSDYKVLFGNGGATFLFDMIGLGAVRSSSLHYVNGEWI